MTVKILTVIVLLLCIASSVKSQSLSLNDHGDKKFGYNFLNDRIYRDSDKIISNKNKIQKVNIGGLFVSPNVGVSFPLGQFGDVSNSGIMYGVKFELAYSRLYPFVFGFVYEAQKNKGNADYTTVNSFTQFDTKIIYTGGSLDVILNKFIKSDFTTAILTTEIKFAKATRTVNPLPPGLETDKSLLTYSAGLAFTIYLFDLSTKYTYAKEFSNLSFQLRVHIPLIRF